MTPLKRVERTAKAILARLVAWLYPPTPLRLNPSPQSFLLVRIDNRVGEALLTTPVFDAIKSHWPDARISALVHPKVAAILAGHPSLDAVVSFSHRLRWVGPWAPEIRALREKSFDYVVDCSNWTDPSVTSAIVARLVSAPGTLMGPSAAPIGRLHDLAVEPLANVGSEIAQRLHLLSPLLVPKALAGDQGLHLSFRPTMPSETLNNYLENVPSPRAVLYPGGRLAWRRAPLAAFAAAGKSLLQEGYSVLVAWGPGEDKLAHALAHAIEVHQGKGKGAPHPPRILTCPPTSVDELAFLFKSSDAVIANNTGPMHLAVAVGTPTLGVFLKMDSARWGHSYPPHQVVDLTSLQEESAQVSALEEATWRFIRDLKPVT